MRKRPAIVLLILALVLFTLLFCACTPDIKLDDPKVVSLTVDGVVTTGYITGNSLDLSDARLFVIYDNNEIEVVRLEESMLDPTSYDMNRPGKQTVKVLYGEGVATFDIYVEGLELESVQLQTEPYVTDYVVGQNVDLAGATIRMFFKKSENSSERKYDDINVTEDMLEDYDKDRLGRQTIYLNYSDTRLSFDVNYTEKTPTSLKIVDPATNNFVFVGLGQYMFYLTTADGQYLNRGGEKVEKAQVYYYPTYDQAANYRTNLMLQNKESGYVIRLKNRFDLTGMTVRIGFDNDQTPKYQAISGNSTELDNNGDKIYADIPDLADHLYVSIDDSTQNTVEAVLMYLPDEYPEEFSYSFYGKPYVEVGSYVTPGMEISSNSMERNGQKITLNSVTSKSYGIVKSISSDVSGRSTIRVSASIEYSMTEISVKEGDIVKHNAPIGLRGRTTIFSVGGGIVTSVRNGVVTIRTAPTTYFTSKAQDKSFKSISLVNQDKITPKLYPDITTTDNMIQGDTIDLDSGVSLYPNLDGTMTERGPVRVDYNDGSYEYFKLNSSFITVVNAGAETTGDGLDISKAGRYELWIVYGGDISYRTSFYVTVEMRYPVGMYVVSSTNTIAGSRFYFGETISVASIRYYIRYNNGDVSEERQLTEDMVGDNYSLYCAPEVSAYDKKVRFTLRDEDLVSIPDGVNKAVMSEEFSCKVLPQSILTPELTVLAEAKKVYVTSDDNIDLTGASYVVHYRNNNDKRLDGKEIEEYEGRELPVGGTTSVMTAVGDEQATLYLDKSTYRLYIDDGSSTDFSSMVRLGVRKTATLLYKDEYYNDYIKEKDDGVWNYYRESDYYYASVNFFYYVINNTEWAVTGMKVNLSSSGGIKNYKDEYSQYEDWDLDGISVTLTTVDYSTGVSSTTVIPATPDMIYDSTTNRLSSDVPVKFYFLGFSDDNTLHISVKKRKEASIELVVTGKNTYYMNVDSEPNFSAYEFYLHYNAGPYDVIKNLNGAVHHRPGQRPIEEGWWYSIFEMNYAIYDISETETVVNELGEPSDVATSHFSKLDAAEEALAEIRRSYPNRVYVIREVRGIELEKLPSDEKKAYVELHHAVKEDDSSTDVFITIVVDVVESTAIKGIAYIGTEDEFIDKEGQVSGKYYAGYGSGKEYAVINRYGETVALDPNGKIIGTIAPNGVITAVLGVQIYYANEDAAETVLGRLNSYSVKEIRELNEVKYCVVNGNETGVNSSGTVGSVLYYTDESSALSGCRWLNERVASGKAAYHLEIDVATRQYVIKNNMGRTVMHDGRAILTYFAGESEAYGYSDALNGIEPKDAANLQTTYIIKRTGLFVDAEFDSVELARRYLIQNDLIQYTVSNKLYVIGEIAAGWNIMLNEFINDNLVQKKLTVYYYDELTDNYYIGEMPISADMIYYDKMDSSVGYRKVTISYKNFSCEAYVYVWRAELTGVKISKEPLTNYIKDTPALDLSDGILELTFTKYGRKGESVGSMIKYISMEDEDVHCSEFFGNLCSKEGLPQTITVLYKDYVTLTTSYVVTVYDLQDVAFTFNNTIYFYGNVSDAGYTMTQYIPEFTLPNEEDIRMYYVEKKNFIPYKQFEEMGLTEDEKKLYLPITVKDERDELATLYYIHVDKMKYTVISSDQSGSLVTKTLPFYTPASGSYFAIYSSYVKKDDEGNIVERYSKTEFEALSDEEKQLCVPVDGKGDIIYMYNETDYRRLSASESVLCQEESNEYFLLMEVRGNKYYETKNYCLQNYVIIPKVIDVKVVRSNSDSYRMKVSTNNNPNAILYLLNTNNMNKIISNIPRTIGDPDKTEDENKNTYNTYIARVAIISPNSEYFELLVQYKNNAPKDYIKKIFNCILSDLSDANGGNISAIYFADNGKLYNPAASSVLNDINDVMIRGVNVFDTLQSDVDYSISYEMNYGETLTKKNDQGVDVLELLSGKLYLRSNGKVGSNNNFTVVLGTLGHPSYTIDLNTTSFDISGIRNINVTPTASSESDYVLRVYMKNAAEVYSRWYVSGRFDAFKTETLRDKSDHPVPEYEFVDDVIVISPNTDFFEIRFFIDRISLDSEQLATLNKLARLFFDNMSNYGAKEVYYGGDVHLFTSDITSEGLLYFFPEASGTQKLLFTGNEKETSITDFYSGYATELNKPAYDDVRSLIDVTCSQSDFIFRVTLFDAWMSTDSERTDLAAILKLFVSGLLDFGGEVYYGGAQVSSATDISFFKSIVSNLGVDVKLRFSMPFRYTGSMYGYVLTGGYEAFLAEIAARQEYSSLVTDLTVLTAETLGDLTFGWTGNTSATTSAQLEKAYYQLLRSLSASASFIMYGSDVRAYYRDETVLSTDLIEGTLKKGINVFIRNDKGLYDVSYNVEYELDEFDQVTTLPKLLRYNDVYVLPSGKLSVGSGDEVTVYTMDTSTILYEITLRNVTITIK